MQIIKEKLEIDDVLEKRINNLLKFLKRRKRYWIKRMQQSIVVSVQRIKGMRSILYLNNKKKIYVNIESIISTIFMKMQNTITKYI